MERPLLYWLLSAREAASMRRINLQKPIARLADAVARTKFVGEWVALVPSDRLRTLASLGDTLRLPGPLAVSDGGTFYLVEQLQTLAKLTRRTTDALADAFALAADSTQLLDIIAFVSMSPLLSMPAHCAQARRALFELLVEERASRAARLALHRAVYALFGVPYDEQAVPTERTEDAEKDIVYVQTAGHGDASEDVFGVPTLIARHLAARLSLTDRLLLQRLSRSFDALIRDDDVEVYRAAFDEMYPALGRLFDHQLPPWLAERSSARAAKLERALGERLVQLDNERVKLDAENAEQRRSGHTPKLNRSGELNEHAALARQLLDSLSIRNRLGSSGTMTSGEMERANIARAWQQLIRSVNAIATHPAVVHSLLRTNTAVAYSGTPIIADAHALAELGVPVDVASPYKRAAGVERMGGHDGGFTMAAADELDAQPRLSGRYFVYAEQLLAARRRTSRMPSKHPTTLVLPVAAAGTPTLGDWHAYRVTDVPVSYRETGDVRAIRSGSQAGEKLRRSFVLSDREEATDGLRIIATAVWHTTRKPAVDRAVYTLGAVDELLLAELEHASIMLSMKWSPAWDAESAAAIELHRCAMRHLDELIVSHARMDKRTLSRAINELLSRAQVWRKPFFPEIFAATQVVHELEVRVAETFAQLFGSADEWSRSGSPGQYAAADYAALRALFAFLVYRRATLANVVKWSDERPNAYDGSIAEVERRASFEPLKPGWAQAVGAARDEAQHVRDSGFEAIRRDPDRRERFLDDLERLGIPTDDVFGDGATKRRASNEIEREKRAHN